MDKRTLIAKPVEEEMKAFEKLYKETLQGHSTDFQSLIDYISVTNGKKIRPLLLLLTAKTCGTINQSTLDYALVLELLHNATLIHDDVVDDTKERRGKASVNAKYDNKVAVLVGDYILSIAIIKAVMTGNMHILTIVSNLAKNLAEGELSQLTNSNKGNIPDEDHYFDIIKKKTAVLLSTCTEIGAMSVSSDPEVVGKFKLFGEYIGLCFQIKDDIFDYYEQGEIGKPTGNDIREGKVTLPLIHALNNASLEEKEKYCKIIHEADFSPENVNALIEFAKEKRGIQYAAQVMESMKNKALDLLTNIPSSIAKDSLIELTHYIVDREK